MWNKQQIQALKKATYAFPGDDALREHLTALNVHLNSYERQPLIHAKNLEWKEIEHEAEEIITRLTALNAGLPSLN